MKLSEHKDLKKEILALSEKEKDKLLLRLVAKDKVLTEHLHFMLMEDESNLRDRVTFIKEEVQFVFDELYANPKTSSKEVLLVLRKFTKQINHFYKVTKADFDELELKFMLFAIAPIQFKYKVYSATKNYEYLLEYYFVKSVLVMFRKFDKLHEDLQFDLKEQANALLSKIYNSSFSSTAKELGLRKIVE